MTPSASIDDKMRYEARKVGGNAAFILANAQAACHVPNDPASENGMDVIHVEKRRKRLHDVTFSAVDARVFNNQLLVFKQGDALALPREERFPDIIGKVLRLWIVGKIARQEIGVSWMTLPQKRKDAFVGENGLP